MTRRSKTSSMKLEEVLARLRNSDQIDGLMIIGSAARNELTLSSDYDLVILFPDLPVPIDIGQTFIDKRVTDLNFITVEEVDRFLETEEPISPYTTNGRILLRMGDGRIELDRSDRLKRAREKVLGGAEVKLFTEQEKHSRWWMMNLFLRIDKRLSVSNDSVNVDAVDLMLNGMLDYLMVDYFNFRDLLWKGEKEAIRYWTIEDPGYLGSFMECLKEGDTRRKLDLYETVGRGNGRPSWRHLGGRPYCHEDPARSGIRHFYRNGEGTGVRGETGRKLELKQEATPHHISSSVGTS